MAVCGIYDVEIDARRENRAGSRDRGVGKEDEKKATFLSRIFKKALQPALRGDEDFLLDFHLPGQSPRPDGLLAATSPLLRGP